MTDNDQITPVVTTAAETSPLVTATTPADDLARVRDLVLLAHPDVVPDLIAGASIDELIASVESARTAYQRIADRVVQPPPVPAGAATNIVDPGDLHPLSKIARALAQRRVMGS